MPCRLFDENLLILQVQRLSCSNSSRILTNFNRSMNINPFWTKWTWYYRFCHMKHAWLRLQILSYGTLTCIWEIYSFRRMNLVLLKESSIGNRLRSVLCSHKLDSQSFWRHPRATLSAPTYRAYLGASMAYVPSNKKKLPRRNIWHRGQSNMKCPTLHIIRACIMLWNSTTDYGSLSHTASYFLRVAWFQFVNVWSAYPRTGLC